MSKDNKSIASRAEDYSQWYLDIIDQAELAENSVTKGSMVIKPYGYSIWENFQKILDKKIKQTGHKNVYFPLFIPKSLLAKESKHVEGFAKEVAVVTHHRLKADPKEGVVVDPDAKLSEELIVRPTSETIMYDTFSRWIKSWRDLPLLINQWANVVRWEMRTRPFLRTTEFLWQEGHTVHVSEEEAEAEARKMLGVYIDFVENYLAISVIPGQKSELEKFAGALRTYCIESMMQDGKALQTGTSHNLGQNFSKAFGIEFTDKENKQQNPWQTSWGVSTRMIGALIMSHSDDAGLVLPPAVAPFKIVIVPIFKNPEEESLVLEAARSIKTDLASVDEDLVVDDRDFETPGSKFNEWEKKGVPLRIEIGPRDVASKSVIVARRDTKEKQTIEVSKLKDYVSEQLEDMQSSLLAKSRDFMKQNSRRIDEYDAFVKQFEEGIPGFVYSHWCGSNECEETISADLHVSIRCIPFAEPEETGKCIKCGMESKKRVVFAKAY